MTDPAGPGHLRLAGLAEVDPEQALLVAALRDEPLPEGAELDEYRLAAVTAWHRLEGVLVPWLAAHDVGTPELREHVAHARAATEQRWRVLATRRRELTRAWAEAGIAPVLLKGAALVEGGVVPAGERPMADVDVLVAARAAEAAHRIARAAGFHEDHDDETWHHARTRHHHLPSLDDGRGTTLEIHHRLLDVAHPLRRLDEVCRSRAVVPVDAVTDRLDDVACWLHLAVHFWDDRRRGTGGPLLQLRDLDRLLARTDLDDLAETAVRGSAGRLVAAVAVVLDAVVPSTPARELAARLGGAGPPRSVRAFVRHRVLGRRSALPQLLHPTNDVPYTAWRVITRTRHQLWPRGRRLRQMLGPDATRTTHLASLAPAVRDALVRPQGTAAEVGLDRWAMRREVAG